MILADTRYFETAIAETLSVEENLAAARAAKMNTLGDIPL